MKSWLEKPKATTVPTPIYNNTGSLVSGAQKYLTQGYSQGIQDRNKQYAGAGQAANGLLDYANKQLSLGSQIDPDVQRQTVLGALSNTSSAGLLPGTPGSRGLVARDLGLTAMDLENSRAKNAGDVLNLQEFRAPDYGGSLASVYTNSELANNQMGNDWIYNQLAANEAVKGKDSFVGGLAKGLTTTATYGALDNATKSL